MLFGLLFATPIFGLAIGSAFGAIGGAFRDYSIDDNFIKCSAACRRTSRPGSLTLGDIAGD